MIAGAEQLEWRITCQKHWRQALAVRDGRQSACDPDGQWVRELGDGIRFYEPRAVERHHDGFFSIVYEQVQKRLVDGWWHAAPVELPPTAQPL
jgi:hypothetical protein